MKRLLIALLLVSTPLFAQTTRDVQKKASRQTANVETITAHKVLSYLDAETQIITPSGGSYNVTLPSTNVWAGWTVKLVNSGAANTLTIKSSDGDTLDVLAAIGRVEFVAKQTGPTDTLHWVNLSKIGTLGATTSSNSCVGCIGEFYEDVSGNVTATSGGTNPATANIKALTAGYWFITANCGNGGTSPLFTMGILIGAEGFSYPANELDFTPGSASLSRAVYIPADNTVYTKIYANSSGTYVTRCRTSYLRFR